MAITIDNAVRAFQKKRYIDAILNDSPYTKESALYQKAEKQMMRLSVDTLMLIHLKVKGNPGIYDTGLD